MSNTGNFGVGGQFTVGDGKPELFGRGPLRVRGSAYIEGPELVGDPTQFPPGNIFEEASLMAGQTANLDTVKSPTPVNDMDPFIVNAPP